LGQPGRPARTAAFQAAETSCARLEEEIDNRVAASCAA